MTKRKTIKKLEALLDALEDSKKTARDRAETDIVIDRIIEYQCEYIRITGHYYPVYKGKHKR